MESYVTCDLTSDPCHTWCSVGGLRGRGHVRGCQPLPVPRVPHQSVGDPVALVLGAAPPAALVIRVTPAPTCPLMLEALRPVWPAQLLLCLVLGGPEGQVVLLLVVAPPAPTVHSLHGLHSLSLELRPAASRGRLVTLLDVIARVLFNLEISIVL